MAIFMGNNVAVAAGGTTITTFVSTVNLNRVVDQVEITSMTNTHNNFVGGIERSTVDLEVFQDFASSSINSIFEDALGTKIALILVPVTGTISTTNPKYSMSVLISEWQPINGTTDAPMTATVSFPVTALTKTTS